MSTQVKRRRGTAAENAAFTGAIAELVFLTDSKRAAIHDAIRAGGYILPTADDLLNGALTRGTASGTNTYALTLPFFPSSYSTGLEIDVTFTNANTGSCTLNVNGVGAAGMKDESGNNFTTGQIGAGSRFTFRHNGTEWRRVSGATASVKTVPLQPFTASGTYTPSAGMLYCIVECIGGGGGGNSGAGGVNGVAGGGGGSGGYSRGTYTAATIGASQSVTIGAGGGAGAGGGTSSLGSLISSGGGGAGTAGAAGGGGGTGGTGASGSVNLRGGNGNAGSGGNGTGGSSSVGGVGGSTLLGGNGGGGNGATSSNGTTGATNTGGGGGGGANGGTGAAGGSGIIIITEYCSQ